MKASDREVVGIREVEGGLRTESMDGEDGVVGRAS